MASEVEIVAVARYLHGLHKTGTMEQKKTWFNFQRKRRDDPVIADPIDIVYAVIDGFDKLGYELAGKYPVNVGDFAP